MLNYTNHWNIWRFAGPPHQEQKLDPKDCKTLLRQGGLLVRNTYDFDCQEKTGFWNLIKDHFGGLEELTSKTRNRINKAFDNLEFRQIAFSEIKEHGYPILKATYEDYAVSDRKMNFDVFDDLLQQYNGQNYDYWGVFDKTNGQLIGFQVISLWDSSCEYTLVGILPQYKRNQTFPYYGLFYSINQYYLQEKGFRYITDGTRSITEHSNIQDFLIEKFNFRKSYCRLAIYYRWWLKLAVKMLYPFRKIIPLQRVKAILNMEAMQRGEK